MRRDQAAERLSTLAGERATARAWARARRARALRAEEGPLLDELSRVLDQRGAAAPGVFAALAAESARARFEQGASLRDVVGELAALEEALLGAWRRREGEALPVEVAELVGELFLAAALGSALEYAGASQAAHAQAATLAMRAALEAASESVLILDAAGQRIWSSARLERLAGADSEAIDAIGRAALRGASPAERQRIRVRASANGESHACEVRALVVRDQERVVGAVALARDVSLELRRAEELARADRQVATLHARLLRLGHDRARAELAAGAALAINNELNALTLRLQLLRGELSTAAPDPTTLSRHLDGSESAARKLAELVIRLGELSTHRQRAPARPVDLDQALMESLDLVRPELTLAAAAQVSVRVDARLGGAGLVLAPGPELRELLCSLLIVVRDLLPDGGAVRIATRREHGSGEVRFALPGTAVGATLELEAARDTARRLGGSLDIDNAGSTVTYRLQLPSAPVQAAEEKQPEPEPARAPAPRPGRRVLIVDDDAGNRETLSELLELSGFCSDAVATSSEALVAARTQLYDAALVDLAMPEMNGWELALKLRSLERDGAPLRIALVTGWDPALEELSPGPVDAIFRKPIHLPAILAFLEQREAEPVYSPPP